MSNTADVEKPCFTGYGWAWLTLNKTPQGRNYKYGYFVIITNSTYIL